MNLEYMNKIQYSYTIFKIFNFINIQFIEISLILNELTFFGIISESNKKQYKINILFMCCSQFISVTFIKR